MRHSPGASGREGRGAEVFRVRASSRVVVHVDHCQARIVCGRSLGVEDTVVAVVAAMFAVRVPRSRGSSYLYRNCSAGARG